MKHRVILSAIALTAALSLTSTGTATAGQDSDRDGYDDDYERRRGSDPYNRDTDGDGIPDGQEYNQGTDPTKRDTDDDGFDDPVDNCPKHSNPDQSDSDGDGKGNACDSDTQSAPTAPIPGAPGPPGLTGGDEAAMGIDGYILDTAPYRNGIYVKVLTQSGAIVPLNVTEANKAQQVQVLVAPTQNGTFTPVPVDITIKGPSLLYIKPIEPVSGVLLFSVPPIGYQTGCNGVELRACGTHARGFYNSVKNRAPIDALDAVPEPLYNFGG